MPTILPLRGKTPEIHPTAWLAPTAVVIGDVVVGPESSVWFGAVVRGDILPIRVGARTNIQDGCVVHTSHDRGPCLVGDDVTVGHGAILHGCTISDRVLVGMGAVVLDDAVVGQDCIVGAGTLLTLGKNIPPRSLVLGQPGKVARRLTDAEVARIVGDARLYVGLHQGY